MPLQPPDAVHEVAFVDVHVNVLPEPLPTEVGDADNDTVGAGAGLVTATDAVVWAVPPAPAQLRVNEALAVNAPVLSLPETAFAPLQPPDAVHEVAFVDVHVNVLLPPLLTPVGDADSVTVGAGDGGEPETATNAFVRAVPPGPVHVIVKVEPAYNGLLRSLPSAALVPLHAPEAVHDVKPLPYQLSLAVPPGLTVFGLPLSTTTGRL